MKDLGVLLETFLEIFKTEFTIWGFTFSWWNVAVFSFVAGAVGWFLWDGVFRNDD